MSDDNTKPGVLRGANQRGAKPIGGDKKASETAGDADDIRARVKAIQKRAVAKRSELAQLPLWPEAVRAIPNEIVRSALFNARNRKTPREGYRQQPLAIIGEGKITYTGEELRQDDQTVWLQLLHQAKAQRVGDVVEFTPYSFCKAVGWSVGGASYQRLRDIFTRLQATSLSVYSQRLGQGVSLSMLPYFRWTDEVGESLPAWQVKVAPELVHLFGEFYFTQVEWKQRLELPDGLATWLHGYLASHKEPYPLKLDTIRLGAGLTTMTNSGLRRTVMIALQHLIDVGFLASFSITPEGVASFVRSKPSI